MSTTDHIICIRQILEKKWEYSEVVHQLFLGGRSCIRFALSFGNHMKLVRLIKMCLIEIYSRVRVGQHLCDMFPIKSGLSKEMPYHHCFSTVL